MSNIKDVSNSKYLDEVSIHYQLFFNSITFSIPSRYISRNLIEIMFFDLFFFLHFCFITDVYLLATEEHYPGRVSQRATTVMPKIKAKFNALGLSQRTGTCPFR